jgi:phosphoribosylformylglycinamidine cyclo-ligase
MGKAGGIIVYSLVSPFSFDSESKLRLPPLSGSCEDLKGDLFRLMDGEGCYLPREYTYASAGVNRELRVKAKEALHFLRKTYRFSRYGKVIQLPYGNLFPIHSDYYLDLVIEGVGTKVLVAQLADKYDTIGIDGVAMAVNDVIRSGARPLAVADNIHAQISEPALVREWMKGIVKGAVEAGCVVPSG